MLKQKLDLLVNKFGPPEKAEPLDQAGVEFCRRMLPAELVDFLSQYGIGTWLNGKFQFCRCDRYANICKLILNGDPQFKPELSAIFGFTAFGQVFVWNREHTVVLKVDLPLQIATANSLGRNRSNPELDISNSLTFIEKNHTDMHEDTPSAPLLFDRALKRLGELELGEIYGFVPALAMGGSAKLDSLKRVKAKEHMALLAQLSRARLMDYNDGKEHFRRMLGSEY